MLCHIGLTVLLILYIGITGSKFKDKTQEDVILKLLRNWTIKNILKPDKHITQENCFTIVYADCSGVV